VAAGQATATPQRVPTMMLRGLESAISPIIQQGSRLGLTPEQQQQLRRIELDFVADVTQLLNERDLLEIEAQKENLATNSEASLTSKQLAAIDEKTAKIRVIWLQGLERAAATLSSDQRAKLVAPLATTLPSFDSAFSASKTDDISAMVTNVVSSRLKDSKVLEIESAQAVVDRLVSWAKSFALVVGVPLALLAIVLGALGISSYSDFKSSISTGQKQMLDQISKLGTETTKEFETRATSLRAGYAEQESKLKELAAIAPRLESIDDRLQRVEQVQFGGESSTPELQRSVQKKIEEYRVYLQKLGYKVPEGKFTITMDSTQVGNAYYSLEENEIRIDPKIVRDDAVIFRPYTHRILSQTNPKMWDNPSAKAQAIWSGFADYLFCSFLGRSIVGQEYVRILSKSLPREMVKRGYLRNVANQDRFVRDEERDPAKTEMHAAGLPWSGAFWEMRTALGCEPTVPGCEVADKILLSSWAGPFMEGPPKSLDQRFVQAILSNFTSVEDAATRTNVRSIFERRGLKLP